MFKNRIYGLWKKKRFSVINAIRFRIKLEKNQMSIVKFRCVTFVVFIVEKKNILCVKIFSHVIEKNNKKIRDEK